MIFATNPSKMKSYFYVLKLLSLFIFFVCPFFVNAQNPLIKKSGLLVSGRVKDRENGEPLPNVTVRVEGTNFTTITNVDGYFTLVNVPADTSVIVFTILGYQPLKHRLLPTLPFKDIRIEMTGTSRILNEVLVTGNKEDGFKLNQKTGMISLTPAAIANLPNLGERDMFRSLQLMPGVSAGNEQTAGLYVRGGTPDQNLVLFDGFTVYNVDHMFGFFSAFNANAVKDLQLHKSAFESKYGGRLSSVVNITGKEGNKKKFNAGADLSLLGINLFAEGPLGNKISGLITYRRSLKTGLYDKIVDKITGTSSSGSTNGPSGPGGGPTGGPSGGPSGGPNGRLGGTSQVKSYFDDLNAKFTYRPTESDVISWSFYTGKDNLDNSLSSSGGGMTIGGGQLGNFNSANSDITKWGNTGTSLKWSRKWGARLFSNTLVSYSNYFSNRLNTRQLRRDSVTTTTTGIIENNDLKDLSVKSDFEWTPFKSHSIGFGYQLTKNDIKYTYARSDTANLVDISSNGKTFAIYLQDKVSVLNNKLVMTPGLRASSYSITGKTYYEPRFDVSYQLNDNIKLKGAAGKYYQFVKRVLREDILQGSRDFWLLADNKRLPVSSAVQFVAGVSWENNDFLFDVEGYYKKLDGLSEYTLRFQPTVGQVNINYEENFFVGTGFARGIDFMLQKKFGKYNGWLGYTIGEAVNNYAIYGSKNFYASNDVRHEFKIVHLLKLKRFDFAITWMYLTGKPYTAPTGGYQVTLLDGSTQSYLVVSEKNALRLANYHRLDAAITYNYGKIGNVNGAITLSLFNIYNRKNVWYKNFQVQDGLLIETDVNYLGFTPNLSFTFKFK